MVKFPYVQQVGIIIPLSNYRLQTLQMNWSWRLGLGALIFASSSRSSNCDFKPDIGRKQALRARRKGLLGALGIALKVMRPLRIPQTPDLGAAES